MKGIHTMQNRRFISKNIVALLIFILPLFIMPFHAAAHTVLLQAVPAPNSLLQTSPTEIRLFFNERLQKELYFIKVLDDKGSSINVNPYVMSLNQKELSLALPVLTDGVYTASYHAISADGHPISGTYVLTIGKPADPPRPIVLGHSHTSIVNVYGFRIVSYILLLTLAGWILWRIFIRFDSVAAEERYRKWLRYFRHLNLLFMFEIVATQSLDSVDDITFPNLIDLWFGTSIGISSIALLLISISAYFVLNRSRWADGIWVLLLLAAKAFNGHAFGGNPPIRTLFVDWIHLIAASVWVGALALIINFWRHHKQEIIRWLPLFSRGALISTVALTISGTISTLLLLPNIEYILYTAWGIFLLVKIGLVGLVIFTGIRIRHYLNHFSEFKLFSWLKRDFALMLCIVTIAAIFTYLSPIPSNAPLDWRFTDGNEQRNVLITPNMPGKNQFTVYLTRAKNTPEMKSVGLRLFSKDHPDLAPIFIQLKLLNKSDIPKTPDSEQYTYSLDGSFIAYPGKWKVELVLRDIEDNERSFAKEMRIY